MHLYHEVFTTFTRIYNDKSVEVPLDIQAHIYDLCHSSAELYAASRVVKRQTGESKRLRAIRPIYHKILDESIHSQSVDDVEPDGTITTLMEDGQLALRAIFEDKNEIGAGNCDPGLQGCLSYIKYWSMDGVCVIQTLLGRKTDDFYPSLKTHG